MNEILARAKERKVTQSYSLPARLVKTIRDIATQEGVSGSVALEAILTEGLTVYRQKKEKIKKAKGRRA